MPDGRKMFSCAVLDGRRNAPAVPGAGCCGWNVVVVVVFRDGFAFGRVGQKNGRLTRRWEGCLKSMGLDSGIRWVLWWDFGLVSEEVV